MANKELTAAELAEIRDYHAECAPEYCDPDIRKLLDNITALQSRITELESDAQFHWKEAADMRAETIIELQARNKELVEALKKYGKHSPYCPSDSGKPCNCGLEIAKGGGEQ